MTDIVKGSYHNRFTALYFEEMGRCQCGGVIVILGEEEG